MKKLTLFSALAILILVTTGHPSAAEPAKPNPTQKVLGIGGLFFKSENPGRLAKWYESNLGITLTPTSYGQEPWKQEAGPTVFAPFKKDTTYFGKPEQVWMVNFRVADLKAMVAQLRAAGIAVEDTQSAPNGDFARTHDPDGNPIELWEPKQPKSGAPEAKNP
jgi:catechol 2,3-dioxygenase-like lactoylglutathione lyase family enzyme